MSETKNNTSKKDELMQRDFARLLGEFEPMQVDGMTVNSLESLAIVVSEITQESYFSKMQEGWFSGWVRDVVGDAKLSRQILYVAHKENLINLTRQRISELREFVRHPPASFFHKFQYLYTEQTDLFCDHEQCDQCGLCVTICPQEALSLPETGKDCDCGLGYLQIDESKCSLCDVCVSFCPTGALSACYNGKDYNFVRELARIPELGTWQEINDRRVRNYIAGSIRLTGPCPEECKCSGTVCAEKCISVCPTGAIRRFRGDAITDRPLIDRDKCILCGACARVCPDKLIEIKRIDLRQEGNEFSTAWSQTMEKLLGQDQVNLYHGKKLRAKLTKKAMESGMVEYTDLEELAQQNQSEPRREESVEQPQAEQLDKALLDNQAEEKDPIVWKDDKEEPEKDDKPPAGVCTCGK